MFALLEMWRVEDETGVSGTGLVAQGCRFDDGTVVLRWLTEWRSTAVYASLNDAERIHGHGGKTKIVVCGNPWARGRRDASQDACEGVPGASRRMGPPWVLKRERDAYLAGYATVEPDAGGGDA